MSDVEIAHLEERFGVALPNAYKQFLEVCGRKAGGFAEDVELLYPAMLDLREELDDMLEETGSDMEIPQDAFVFSGYQGFQYHFFVCDGNEDPAVFRVKEGDRTPTKISNSFTEYLKMALS